MKMYKITFMHFEGNFGSIIGYQYVRSENQAKLIVNDFKSNTGYDAKYEVRFIPENKEK